MYHFLMVSTSSCHQQDLNLRPARTITMDGYSPNFPRLVYGPRQASMTFGKMFDGEEGVHGSVRWYHLTRSDAGSAPPGEAHFGGMGVVASYIFETKTKLELEKWRGNAEMFNCLRMTGRDLHTRVQCTQLIQAQLSGSSCPILLYQESESTRLIHF